MKSIYCFLIVIFLSSCWGKDNTNIANNKKVLFNDLHQFAFENLNDSIKKVEGDFCYRSNKYKWINRINNRTISIPIGIYNKNCKHITGRMPYGRRKVLYIGENSFLYGYIEYPYDSISKVLNEVMFNSINGKLQKEIFLYYPNIEDSIDFLPLLRGVEKYMKIMEKKNDSTLLPVFYFIMPTEVKQNTPETNH